MGSDSAAQDSSTPDSSEATDAEATSDEDSNKGTDEASDEVSDADIEAPLAENSWRYVDGSLRSDLPDDYGANADFEGRAMHSMPKGATAQGIDVSEHNGTIDWQSVKDAGIDFAILRVGFAGDTSGGRLDNYFRRNVSECERLGIPYGVVDVAHGKYAFRIYCTRHLAHQFGDRLLVVVAVATHIIGHVEGDFALQFLPFGSIRLPVWILRNCGCCTLRTGC